MGKKVMKEDPTALDLLRHARGLIEKGWAREAMARTRNGRACSAVDERAACFCSWGAIERARVDLGGRLRTKDKALKHLQQGILRSKARNVWLNSAGNPCVASFNDNRSRKEPVLRAFDLAIDEALLEQTILAVAA